MNSHEASLADALLLQFCRRFQHLYGNEDVTPNMHMHSHLIECVKDFGPITAFWLFSFERYNGILGDEPTNNRLIELQLIRRFVQDNSHLQLLSYAGDSSEADHMFSLVVKDHAFAFDSMKHLDNHLSVSNHCSSGFVYVPAKKYTLATFSDLQLNVLSQVYCILYPELSHHFTGGQVILPCSYRTMLSITVNGQQINAGQYVLAKSLFRFESAANDETSVSTIFTDPSLRAAKINHFAIHSFMIDDSTHVTHAFAIVSWMLCHPLRHSIGKPYQIWCNSLYEPCIQNFLLPLENISSLLITAQCL